MILPIKKFPEEVLRQPCQEVSFPLSEETRQLAMDMLETVRSAEGIGLAAPQVGRSLKLIVINLEKSGMPAFPLFNARIVRSGKKKVLVEEGCLSIPGVFGMVSRPRRVTIQAQDWEGKTINITDEGWLARVAQHEIDHTVGVLILDLITEYTQGAERVKAWKDGKLL